MAVGDKKGEKRDAAFFLPEKQPGRQKRYSPIYSAFALGCCRAGSIELSIPCAVSAGEVLRNAGLFPAAVNDAAYQEIAACQHRAVGLADKGRSQPFSAKLHRPLKCGFFRWRLRLAVAVLELSHQDSRIQARIVFPQNFSNLFHKKMVPDTDRLGKVEGKENTLNPAGDSGVDFIIYLTTGVMGFTYHAELPHFLFITAPIAA